ncbi:MAG TPA: condensation domain-containing protein, partial [Actinocrinis sp.]|nr:condensation domain-containing protein [Actinocrinis sp.]
MSTHNVEDVYGLSPLQFGMLFHSLEDTSDTRPYMVQMTEQIDGPFDPDCFRDAWQGLVDRHTILRSAFVWEGVSEPLQVVQRTARLPFAAQDWRHLPPGEREDRLRRFLAADWDQGFDLSRAPLVRVTLLRTEEAQWIAVWSFHHILIDGWSVQILQSELSMLYRSRLAGRTPVPQPPPIPFRRYIQWLGAQQPADAETFWTRYLSGMSGAAELGIERAVREVGGDVVPGGSEGTDTNGPADRGIGEVEFVADEVFTTRAREYARQQRITMNTLVQGVWSLLLSRYSGSDDIVFGSTVSGRSADLPGVDTMMGLFINTLPVRVKLDGAARVGEWLRQVQDEQLDLRQWEHSHLVDVHKYSGIPRGEPLFRSILVFENYPVIPEAGDDGLPEGMTSKLIGCVERTGYPLTLVVSAGRDFEFRLVYDRSIYPDDAMRRLVVHLRTLLESVVDGEDAALVSGPGMVAGEELASVVSGCNETAGWFPDGATIHGLIQDRAAASAGDVAVVCGDRSLTFGEVWDRAESLARHLVSAGVGPGSLVG